MENSTYMPKAWSLALANIFLVINSVILFFDDRLSEVHTVSLFIVLLINQMYVCTLAIIKTLENENA